jgi:hypothetical protein
MQGPNHHNTVNCLLVNITLYARYPIIITLYELSPSEHTFYVECPN